MSGLQRDALILAHLTAIETKGSKARRTEAAIWAYLWAVENHTEQGSPSLDQLREALAEARRKLEIL